MSKWRPPQRNPVAKLLRTPRYRKQIVRNTKGVGAYARLTSTEKGRLKNGLFDSRGFRNCAA